MRTAPVPRAGVPVPEADLQDPSATVESATTTSAACDTLYYDGQCSLCAAEIESLRRERSDALALVDEKEQESNTK